MRTLVTGATGILRRLTTKRCSAAQRRDRPNTPAAERARLFDSADSLRAADMAETTFKVAILPPRVNVDFVELMPVRQAFGPATVHRVDG